jgi:hypothetical protein
MILIRYCVKLCHIFMAENLDPTYTWYLAQTTPIVRGTHGVAMILKTFNDNFVIFTQYPTNDTAIC